MDIRGRIRTVFVLSGGVLSTKFMPDTEEVTGSIPVSPTSIKWASEQRKRRSEALCVSLCSDTVLAEWRTCLTNCVTMVTVSVAEEVFWRPWGSVTVHSCPTMGLGPSSPRKGFGISVTQKDSCVQSF